MVCTAHPTFMQTATSLSLLHSLSPMRLAGPIFGKELRVASRQRKYYLLRFVYVCLLAFVTLEFWYAVARVGGGASSVAQVSRLSEVGKSTIVAIVVFQFVAAQVLTAVLLSDAISSEIRQRTLEGLLVTPIGAVHLVVGKLLSRLFQVCLLLAISLPVLAVARVFGGVPWDYVVSGVCITLSASVFAGALSLFCSIGYRHAYHAFLAVAFWYLVVWGLLTFTMTSSLAAFGSARATFILSLINPIAALVERTQTIIRGAGGASMPAPLWAHCLTMLCAAAAFLAVAVPRVRRIALVLGRPSLRSPMTDRLGLGSLFANPLRMHQTIRHVRGAPVVWKDMCMPLFQARRQAVYHIALWVTVVACFLVVVSVFLGIRSYGGIFLPLQILQWFFLIRLAVAAAGAITREKEARTWPILLATPLENRDIVKSKAVAAFRKNVGLLVPLLALYLIVSLRRPGRPSSSQSFSSLFSTSVVLAFALIFFLGLGWYLTAKMKTTRVARKNVAFLVPLLVLGLLLSNVVPGLILLPQSLIFFLSSCVSLAGAVVFLLGVGLYLSTRLKTSTAAIVSTLALYFVPKLLFCGTPLPWFLLTRSRMFPGSMGAMWIMTFVPPVVFAGVGVSCLRAATRRLRHNVC